MGFPLCLSRLVCMFWQLFLNYFWVPASSRESPRSRENSEISAAIFWAPVFKPRPENGRRFASRFSCPRASIPGSAQLQERRRPTENNSSTHRASWLGDSSSYLSWTPLFFQGTSRSEKKKKKTSISKARESTTSVTFYLGTKAMRIVKSSVF